jgi:putative nucleotidyltransferase with HDIG domain
MSATISDKIRLATAGILSLFAQIFLFAPARLTFLPTSLPNWGISAIGAANAALSVYLFVVSLRTRSYGGRVSRILVAIQVFTTVGLYFLLDGSASYAREAGFLLSSLITLLTTYGVFLNTIAVNGSHVRQVEPVRQEGQVIRTSNLESNIDVVRGQLASATQSLNAEKYRTTQLTFLNELSRQLETELDPPVAAQIAVNTLERTMECTLVSLMMYEPDQKEFVALATAGRMTSIIPPGYRQDADTGLLGRAARSKKTQIVNDTTTDPDFVSINNENTVSEIVVPILQHGQIKGVMEVCSDKPNAFGSADAAIAEGVVSELTRAWERSNYNQRLTELIQGGISLTTLLDPQAAVQEIAILARKTLEARFVFITLLDQQGNFSRTASAGDAPKLLRTLNENPSEEPLLQAALNASKPFRIRDLRKYTSAKNLEIDNAALRSTLAMPIRLHRLSIGAIIAFGKQEGVFFSENDESLADLLASQAAASIESSWLYQELRNALQITSMLRQLSEDVIQTDELSKAAELIAHAAHKATNARATGIVLLAEDGRIQAEVELDANGLHTRHQHPMETVRQAIQLGQSIFVARERASLVCYPLLTRARAVGALWLDIPETRGHNFANIQILANQSAVSLERFILLTKTLKQAKEIEAAYEELEATYDQTLSALMSALDARDRETEGHSMRVSRLACLLGEQIGLNGQQLKALERGALLHDIGKIGISDTILHKPDKLTDEEWMIMRVHPDIGARIIERIPFLQECMPVVRYHHERWDGSGYPLGLQGKNIPIQARIFAVADVFDALTSKRSYRKKSSAEDALKYLREHSDVLFDAEIVEALAKIPYAEFTEGSMPRA